MFSLKRTNIEGFIHVDSSYTASFHFSSSMKLKDRYQESSLLYRNNSLKTGNAKL